MSAPWIQLLGPPRIEGQEGSAGRGAAQRHRLAMLALLALAPDRRMSRDRLATMLWPETESEKARHLLSVGAYAIRKALGDDTLLAEGEALELNVEHVRVDVLEFERAIRNEDPAAAVDLYRGRFLDGLTLPQGVEFERWQEREAARLEALYHDALEQVAETAAAERGAPASIAMWRRRLASAPADARVAILLMRALAKAGDRVGAVHVAAEHSRILEHEYGLPPDPGVQNFAADVGQMSPEVDARPVVRGTPVVRSVATHRIRQPPGNADAAFAPPRRRSWLSRPVLGGIVAAIAFAAIVWAAARTDVRRHGERVAVSPSSRVVDPAAHNAWVRARLHLERRTPEDLDACIREAQLAIRADSAFANGYAVKGACHFVSTYYGTTPPGEAFALAEQAGNRALALDPAHAGAHVVLGWVAAGRDWDWNRAERLFRRAVELNPAFDYGRVDYATFLAFMGRHDEASAEMRAAQHLNPTGVNVADRAAWLLYAARRFDEAVVQARHALTLDSTYYPAHERLAAALAAKGRYIEAVSVMERAVALAPGQLRQRGFLGYLYGRAGRVTDARRVRNELMAMSKHAYVPPTAIALVHVGLDELDAAFEAFQRAFVERDADLVFVRVWPTLDGMHRDPRFRRLLQGLRR